MAQANKCLVQQSYFQNSVDQTEKCSYIFGKLFFLLTIITIYYYIYYLLNSFLQCLFLFLQSLDEVHVEVETCEDLRDMSSPQGLSSYTGPAKYSYIHKIIDGITVAVNMVSITFKSPAFIAKVQVKNTIS